MLKHKKEAKEAIFKIFLKSKGLNYTCERKFVLREILEATKKNEHFSVDNIFKRMLLKKKRVSKSALYKTMPLLEDCNLIKKTNIAEDHYIYEKTGKHNIGHLVCLTCKQIIEINKNTIKDHIDQICAKKSFKIESHTFEIKGRCFNCLKRK